MKRPFDPTSSRLVFVLVSAAALASGCNDNFGNPSRVIDTTGERFTWTCYSDGCDVASEADLAIPCGGAPNDGYLYSRGRFVEICPAYESGGLSSTSGELCRLLACVDDGECPRYADDQYACENGLCQLEGHDGLLSASDMLALCLADVPRAADCADARTDPAVMMAYAQVEAACGTEIGATCASVPDGCRVP